MASIPTREFSESKRSVEKSASDELIAILELHRGPLVPPVITPEQKAAMAHNMWVNLHRYEDPMDYMFDYSDEWSSSEDDK